MIILCKSQFRVLKKGSSTPSRIKWHKFSPFTISIASTSLFSLCKKKKKMKLADLQTDREWILSSTNWPRCSGSPLQGGTSGPGGTQSERRMDCCACWRGREVRPPRRGWGTEDSCPLDLGSRSPRLSARAGETPHRMQNIKCKESESMHCVGESTGLNQGLNGWTVGNFFFFLILQRKTNHNTSSNLSGQSCHVKLLERLVDGKGSLN